MPIDWDIWNTENCDCWKLTRTIDSTDKLPDHICPTIGPDSCVNWAREYASIWPGGELAPAFMAFGDRQIYIKSYPMSFYYPGLDPNSAGMIYLVIRQWVERGDEMLKRELTLFLRR